MRTRLEAAQLGSGRSSAGGRGVSGRAELSRMAGSTSVGSISTVSISAVVCTHNRAEYLAKALVSLSGQSLPAEQYEVLVIDNSSTDKTPAVAEAYLGRSNWRYIHEPVLGLSRARNTGWRAAQGQYVAYLDDDAVASEGWLAGIEQAFEMFGPAVACIGGRCLPIWEAERPRWLADQMLSVFSIYHYADAPLILNDRQWLSGCNIAYRREALERVDGFPESLGRQGMKLLAQEEIFVRQCLEGLGLASAYQPGAVVGHHLPARRLTKQWFRQHAYWQGRSSAALAARQGDGDSLSKRAGRSLVGVAWALPRLALMLASPRADARFRREYQVIERAGFIAGLWDRGLPG